MLARPGRAWYRKGFGPGNKVYAMETHELKAAIAELEARVQHIREWL